jgi:excisionase family DNA binding protein
MEAGAIAPLTRKRIGTLSKTMEGEGDARGGGGRKPRRLGDGKLCYTVPEAAALIGVSRNNGYELAKRGEIPTIRFGKRIMVPKVKFHRMFGEYPESEVITS